MNGFKFKRKNKIRTISFVNRNILKIFYENDLQIYTCQ